MPLRASSGPMGGASEPLIQTSRGRVRARSPPIQGLSEPWCGSEQHVRGPPQAPLAQQGGQALVLGIPEQPDAAPGHPERQAPASPRYPGRPAPARGPRGSVPPR